MKRLIIILCVLAFAVTMMPEQSQACGLWGWGCGSSWWYYPSSYIYSYYRPVTWYYMPFGIGPWSWGCWLPMVHKDWSRFNPMNWGCYYGYAYHRPGYGWCYYPAGGYPGYGYPGYGGGYNSSQPAQTTVSKWQLQQSRSNSGTISNTQLGRSASSSKTSTTGRTSFDTDNVSTQSRSRSGVKIYPSRMTETSSRSIPQFSANSSGRASPNNRDVKSSVKTWTDRKAYLSSRSQSSRNARNIKIYPGQRNQNSRSRGNGSRVSTVSRGRASVNSGPTPSSRSRDSISPQSRTSSRGYSTRSISPNTSRSRAPSSRIMSRGGKNSIGPSGGRMVSGMGRTSSGMRSAPSGMSRSGSVRSSGGNRGR